MKQFWKTLSLAVCMTAIALPAFAQQPATAGQPGWTDPEGGEEGTSTWTDPNAQPQTPAPNQQPVQPQPRTVSAPTPTVDEESPTGGSSSAPGNSDHEKVAVGHFGAGFFGVMSLPYGVDSTGSLGSVSAPTIGLRYWFSPSIGFEGALGFGFSSQSRDTGGAGSNPPAPSALGFAVHAGVPIALYYASHYKFLVIPEVNFGITDGSDMAKADPTQEDLFGGMLIQVGARAGAEIHFGFIGIPELAVQGTVGLAFNYKSYSGNVCTTAATATTNCGPIDISSSAVSIGTSVDADPWDIFAGSVNAIYYF